MSFLQFMEMGILESLLNCVIAFALCMSFSSIGHFFLKGNKFALQSLFGMAFCSVFVMLCMSYCAYFSKYVVYAFSVFAIILGSISLIKKWNKKQGLIKSFLPTFFIFLYFVIRFLLLITQKTGFVNFNCHETYFAAPAFEIFKADYYSRLRIFDLYPYEWSRYHFFNGAFTSIPLSVFAKKNYVTYIFAKYLTIAFLLGAIFDCIREKKGVKKACVYFIFGCVASLILSYNMVTWSSFTNNYSSLLLMGITWILMMQEDWKSSCMASLILAISTSRATLTGGFFFLFSLYMLFKKDKENLFNFISSESKTAFFCVIMGFGSIVMVISGMKPNGQGVLDFNFMGNMFHYGWMVLMPFGTFFGNRSIFPKETAVYQIHFEFLILFAYVYMIIHGYDKIKKFIINNFKILFVIAIFTAELLFIHGFNIKDLIFISTAFTILYLLPIMAIYASSSETLSIPLGLFIISSIMQYMVFNSGSSCVNYTLIVAPVVICFSKMFVYDISNKMINSKFPKRRVLNTLFCIATLCICSGYLLSYDFSYSAFWTPKDDYSVNLRLREIPYSEKAFEYCDDSDADMAKLNALKGNRVHYKMVPNIENPYHSKNSMTIRFLPKGYDKQ
ncbi:MAG: hypothetical protein ACI4LX_05745 [Treponema sp.]